MEPGNNEQGQPTAANPALEGLPQDRRGLGEGALPDGGKRKDRKWTVVLVVAVIVFVCAIGALIAIGLSYFQGQQKYQELEQYASVASTEDAEVPEEKPLASLTVDWASLLERNPDTVAWLFVPNTAINYPVVQGEDNEYYLTHDFNGDKGWIANYGAIFMDSSNKPNWSDDAYFIYGHHMNDGSMFADLAGMLDQARFDECRTAYVLSPTGNFRLRTFAVIHCAADDAIVQPRFGSRAEMTAYVQDKIDRSVVKCDDIPAADKMRMIFAFATCDNASDRRYVLYAYVEGTTTEGLKGSVGVVEGDDAPELENELWIEE